jgi:hypothetical protein
MDGSEPRRSSRRIAVLPSKTAHDETDFEPYSAGSESDTHAFSPAEEIKPNTKKRATKTTFAAPKANDVPKPALRRTRKQFPHTH